MRYKHSHLFSTFYFLVYFLSRRSKRLTNPVVRGGPLQTLVEGERVVGKDHRKRIQKQYIHLLIFPSLPFLLRPRALIYTLKRQQRGEEMKVRNTETNVH